MKKCIVTTILLLSLAKPTLAEHACEFLYFTHPKQYDTTVLGCNHGGIRKDKDGNIIMYQDAFYGPDCKLRVYSVEKPMKSVVLEAQQNLCALEAGSIHVKQISASRPSLKAKYTTKEGSYSEELPGKVIFSGF